MQLRKVIARIFSTSPILCIINNACSTSEWDKLHSKKMVIGFEKPELQSCGACERFRFESSLHLLLPFSLSSSPITSCLLSTVYNTTCKNTPNK